MINYLTKGKRGKKKKKKMALQVEEVNNEGDNNVQFATVNRDQDQIFQ